MSDQPEKPELGQWLTITTTFRKTKNWPDVYWHRDRWQKEPMRGMFIGTRQVYDGKLESDGDYSAYFIRTVAHNVWLFVLDGRRNPVYVLPEDVTP